MQKARSGPVRPYETCCRSGTGVGVRALAWLQKRRSVPGRWRLNGCGASADRARVWPDLFSIWAVWVQFEYWVSPWAVGF
ncbi:RNA polymerase II [Gossypium arboreum]|uniref:RNA polymerase II n=1 Tax=Gossypium arboreum TaxID=29729 RepID=A0A0B0PBJ1_GOSAR|nr:RNA polymerase II [Gossypium arboreum]